jgi:hypothetical protein
MPDLDEHNPLHHTRKMRERFSQTVRHLRADVTKIEEPRAKALFETSAEVLNGLIKALDDYERKDEPAWRANP